MPVTRSWTAFQPLLWPIAAQAGYWKLMASLTGILVAQVVIYALMGVFIAAPWAMAVLLRGPFLGMKHAAHVAENVAVARQG